MAFRRVLLLLAVGVVTLLGSARQQDDPVAQAAEALRRDPVYVDPSAERALTDAEAGDLRDQIRSSDTALFVAVLPSAAGDADDVVRRLVDETGLSGTYAAVVGDGFRATSTDLPRADELATAAFQAASADGTVAVLSRFVDEVADGAGGSTAGAAPGGSDATGDDGGGGGGGLSLVLLALVGVAGGGGALWWWRRRQRREAERRARIAADRELLRAELDVLADDILRLEPEVSLHPDANDDYEAALERHRVASAAFDHADEPVDLVRVRRVVDEARYAMSRAKALVAGHEPPPPPEQLRRPGHHAEPPLDLDDRGVPVYGGGQPFHGGGWYGGGGGGGLFEGLLLGSMLGGGWGWGWGGPVVIDNDTGSRDSDDWRGDGDGGDGDSGDWGSGDLGGGDWGGGDGGGGDWGGDGGDMGGGDW